VGSLLDVFFPQKKDTSNRAHIPGKGYTSRMEHTPEKGHI
jgi:hypothetical protein